jgi:ankyrin repeat protein
MLYLFQQIHKYGFRGTFWPRTKRLSIIDIFLTKNGNLDDVKKLCKTMPNDQFLRLKLCGNYTLLIKAASEGFLDIVEFLLSIGADPNECSNNGESPLHRACYFNRLEIVKVLIKGGAKLEHKSMQRITPLQTAVIRNKAEIVRTLLEAGAKFDLKCDQIEEQHIKPEVRKVLDDYQR